jgi:4-amino-4-deoxy-L-arabinose transferase-like glycosyltransferase
MLNSLRLHREDKRWLGVLLACPCAIFLGYGILRSPEISAALLLGGIVALICLAVVAHNPADQKFLVRLFLGALCVRWIVAILIHNTTPLRPLIGDAYTYSAFGQALSQFWSGEGAAYSSWLVSITNFNKSGWGMIYYIAAIYYLVGQNLLAAAFVTASFGALTAVVVYRVVMLLFEHVRVARTAAVLVAFAPSMIIWSSYPLKDGLIVLCLSLCAYHSLKLREKISFQSVALLLVFLFCLYSLRHYVFMVLFVAVIGGIILGAKKLSPARILQGGVLVLILSFVFVYFGARDVAEKNLDLKRIQSGRVWSAKVANTGYGAEVDITDARAAITFLPIGMSYVLLAPFPWMINSFGQVITLPELILWWLAFPFLLKGYWFSLRHRLKHTLTICLFTLGLTLVYALYQTNVGTAYRQRAQLYVFFFIFISVGWELRRKAKMLKQAEQARWYEQLRTRYTRDAPAVQGTN